MKRLTFNVGALPGSLLLKFKGPLTFLGRTSRRGSGGGYKDGKDGRDARMSRGAFERGALCCASACCFEARRLFEATNSSAFSQACTTRASITCKVSGSAAQDRTVDSRVRGGVEELQCRCCTLAKPAPYVD